MIDVVFVSKICDKVGEYSATCLLFKEVESENYLTATALTYNFNGYISRFVMVVSKKGTYYHESSRSINSAFKEFGYNWVRQNATI